MWTSGKNTHEIGKKLLINGRYIYAYERATKTHREKYQGKVLQKSFPNIFGDHCSKI